VIDRVCIVGTGLMGASVGLAAKGAGVGRVAGYDADASALTAAIERGAVDDPHATMPEALAGADLAVVAVPVAALPRVTAEILAVVDDACIVTDVGSTKASVCAAAGEAPRFVGGHPVCGSEASGPAHASAELFEGATWFLTPLASTDPNGYRAMHAFVSRLGALPVAIDPGAHDRLVALTSHLPHVLANLLVNQAGASRIEGHDPLSAAGGSLRDATRVAGANPRIWLDIFLDNRREIITALSAHRQAVAAVEAALEAGDTESIASWVAEAADNRRRVLRAAYAADPGDLYRVRVRVADEPGMLARITQALGAERINIEDFELRHLSPERGGWLGILLAGQERAEHAAALLEGEGYGVLVAPAAASG
jgi:prephenate dehydrogenase